MGQPRNKFEVKLWNSLKPTGRAKYEAEKLDYKLFCTYLPDFTLIAKDGHKIFIEGKGKFDATARRKMRAVKDQHPEIDIRIVFYNASAKMRKGSNTTNAEWAAKNGFECADSNIPKKWLKE